MNNSSTASLPCLILTLFNIPVEDRENMNTWVKRMEEQIQVQKYETYFVTHGYGTLAALKYIEKTAIGKIEGLFSISGFKEDALLSFFITILICLSLYYYLISSLCF